MKFQFNGRQECENILFHENVLRVLESKGKDLEDAEQGFVLFSRSSPTMFGFRFYLCRSSLPVGIERSQQEDYYALASALTDRRKKAMNLFSGTASNESRLLQLSDNVYPLGIVTSCPFGQSQSHRGT